tara:strand:+ start:315 stop:518 length:204 start_codon:yes stop_codon:yes gene_type:complete
VTKLNAASLVEVIKNIPDLAERREMALNFALWLASDNPSFDASKFLVDCMVSEGNEKKSNKSEKKRH